jgi:hypothetical protein
MSDFDLGYRDALWARLEEKDAEIAQLKKSFEQTSLIAEQLFEKHLAAKDAEIARLTAIVEDLSDHGCAAERMDLIKAQFAEIERLKAGYQWLRGQLDMLALQENQTPTSQTGP